MRGGLVLLMRLQQLYTLKPILTGIVWIPFYDVIGDWYHPGIMQQWRMRVTLRRVIRRP